MTSLIWTGRTVLGPRCYDAVSLDALRVLRRPGVIHRIDNWSALSSNWSQQISTPGESYALAKARSESRSVEVSLASSKAISRARCRVEQLLPLDVLCSVHLWASLPCADTLRRQL